MKGKRNVWQLEVLSDTYPYQDERNGYTLINFKAIPKNDAENCVNTIGVMVNKRLAQYPFSASDNNDYVTDRKIMGEMTLLIVERGLSIESRVETWVYCYITHVLASLGICYIGVSDFDFFCRIKVGYWKKVEGGGEKKLVEIFFPSDFSPLTSEFSNFSPSHTK